MEIRQGEVKDVEEISRVHALSWKSAYQGKVRQEYLDNLAEDFWVGAFTEWMAKGLVRVMVLMDQSTIVGCVAYGKARDESKSGWGEIISLYSLPEYWGQGFGRKLLCSAVSDLHAMGLSNHYLWVLKENKSAQQFYIKQGWIETADEILCDIAGQTVTEVRYIYEEAAKERRHR